MKNKKKCTPGPWEVHRHSDDVAGRFERYYIGPREGRQVARMIQDDAEALANAKLCAAAPSLGELLARILGMNDCKNNGLYNGEAILSPSVAEEIRYKLKAAGVELHGVSLRAIEKEGGR